MKTLFIILLTMTVTSSIHGAVLPVLFGTSQGRNNDSRGIYASSFDTVAGRLGEPALAAELGSAGFQVLHPKLPVVYSIGVETGSNTPGVFSFSMNAGGGGILLKPLNNQPTEAGRGTHLDIDPSGRLLVTAQYGDGTVSVFPVAADGSLMPTTQTVQHTVFTNANPGRQEKPHPHNVTFSPCGDYVLVPDLGADVTYIYKVDYDNIRLLRHGQAKSAPGAGPRHMKFSRDGAHAYILNELTQTVDAFSWDAATGKVEHLATVEGLPRELIEPGSSHSASEIRIHPSQRFLYTANRGHNSLSVFSINPDSGIPELLEVVTAKVDWPRNFALDPDGNWLICGGQNSNDVSVFSVNPDSGRIRFVENSIIAVPGPICVLPVDR